MANPKEFNKVIMDMDKIELDKFYTLTVSPNDDYQYFKEDGREEAFKRFWRVFFKNMKQQIVLHPELSPKGRLHFHGTIKFPTAECIKDFYLNKINPLLLRSQVEIDTIKDAEVWTTYCTKQKQYFDWIINNQKDKCLDIKQPDRLYKNIMDY